MIISPGNRDITVYIGFRPFEGEWLEQNKAVLKGLSWQNTEGVKVKFVCWPSESSTVEYATNHGYQCVVIPWYRQYLFPGPLRSFKNMFETILMDCDTELFVYINGDIILGPGILHWLQSNIEQDTLYSLPRHNWAYSGTLETTDDFKRAFDQAVPEEWTALDIFAMRATDARKNFIPTPPFLLTAGSMDSWLVVQAGHLGWRRNLIPPDQFHMLHIEHSFSHPLKPGASPEKLAKWAFNCGIYAMATEHISLHLKCDAALTAFEGADRYKFKYNIPTRKYARPEDVMQHQQTQKE